MKKRLGAAQKTYKNNYDGRLKKQARKIEMDDFLYLRVERKDPKQHLRELTIVSEGPYQVTDVDSHTLVIENTRSLGPKIVKFTRCARTAPENGKRGSQDS